MLLQLFSMTFCCKINLLKSSDYVMERSSLLTIFINYRHGGLLENVYNYYELLSDCKNNILKLQYNRLKLKKKSFPMRLVRHWNRFPKGVMNASSPRLFRARLDGF